MPPAALPKGGIAVPGTPFAVTRWIFVVPAIARYMGFASEIAAPFFPSTPWQAAQFWA
jgi:hypothetical protein